MCLGFIVKPWLKNWPPIYEQEPFDFGDNLAEKLHVKTMENMSFGDRTEFIIKAKTLPKDIGPGV